jgi:co-chaperonin GroES (HSP10)
MVSKLSSAWAYGHSIVFKEPNIKICPSCFKKYIPTPKAFDNCLFCTPKIKLYDPPKVKFIPAKDFCPRPTYSHILKVSREAVKRWRKKNPDRVREYKRNHKERHPEAVSSWNDRYRNRNRKRLQLQHRLAYKLKTTMTPVNNYVIVLPVKAKEESKTKSGIILAADGSDTMKYGKVVYVCKEPCIATKKGDTLIYPYGMSLKDKGVEYEIVNLKEVIAIMDIHRLRQNKTTMI